MGVGKGGSLVSPAWEFPPQVVPLKHLNTPCSHLHSLRAATSRHLLLYFLNHLLFLTLSFPRCSIWSLPYAAFFWVGLCPSGRQLGWEVFLRSSPAQPPLQTLVAPHRFVLSHKLASVVPSLFHRSPCWRCSAERGPLFWGADTSWWFLSGALGTGELPFLFPQPPPQQLTPPESHAGPTGGSGSTPLSHTWGS